MESGVRITTIHQVELVDVSALEALTLLLSHRKFFTKNSKKFLFFLRTRK